MFGRRADVSTVWTVSKKPPAEEEEEEEGDGGGGGEGDLSSKGAR